MIFNSQSNPIEIDLNTDTNIVTIRQRVFGSTRINTVTIPLDNLREFLEAVNE